MSLPEMDELGALQAAAENAEWECAVASLEKKGLTHEAACMQVLAELSPDWEWIQEDAKGNLGRF